MNLDVRHIGGATSRVVWSIFAVLALLAGIMVVSAPPASAWPAKISIGGELNTGERLVSPNGDYNLMMQENGNLVLRKQNGTIIWHPEMDGSGAVKAEITNAGNVVLRQSDGDVMWASGTSRWAQSATTIEVTNSGNVLLSNAARDHLWRVGMDPAIRGVEAMIEYAKAQLGKPYGWGDHGPSSFDCSGLTYMSARAGGRDMGRHQSANTQYGNYATIPRSEMRRGDLLFMDWEGDGHVDHVGIYLGGGRMINAVEPGVDLRIQNVPSSYKANIARMLP